MWNVAQRHYFAASLQGRHGFSKCNYAFASKVYVCNHSKLICFRRLIGDAIGLSTYDLGTYAHNIVNCVLLLLVGDVFFCIGHAPF